MRPWTWPPTRRVLCALGAWVAMFENSSKSDGCSSTATALSAALSTRCLVVGDHGADGAQLFVWDAAQLTRSIQCMRDDSGDWFFHLTGDPLAFEDVASYAARLKRNRFGSAQLRDYLGALGVTEAACSQCIGLRFNSGGLQVPVVVEDPWG